MRARERKKRRKWIDSEGVGLKYPPSTCHYQMESGTLVALWWSYFDPLYIHTPSLASMLPQSWASNQFTHWWSTDRASHKESWIPLVIWSKGLWVLRLFILFSFCLSISFCLFLFLTGLRGIELDILLFTHSFFHRST